MRLSIILSLSEMVGLKSVAHINHMAQASHLRLTLATALNEVAAG